MIRIWEQTELERNQHMNKNFGTVEEMPGLMQSTPHPLRARHSALTRRLTHIRDEMELAACSTLCRVYMKAYRTRLNGADNISLLFMRRQVGKGGVQKEQSVHMSLSCPYVPKLPM